MSKKDAEYNKVHQYIKQSVNSVNKGQVDKAIELLFKAKETIQNNIEVAQDDILMADVLRKIAALYISKNKLQESLNLGFEALTIAKKNANNELYAALSRNIATVYALPGELQNLTLAENYFQEAIPHYKDINDMAGVISSYLGIANIYNDKLEIKEAENIYKLALSESQENNYLQGIISSSKGLANIYKQQYKYSKALTYLYKVMKVFQNNKMPDINTPIFHQIFDEILAIKIESQNIGLTRYREYFENQEFSFKLLKKHELLFKPVRLLCDFNVPNRITETTLTAGTIGYIGARPIKETKTLDIYNPLVEVPVLLQIDDSFCGIGLPWEFIDMVNNENLPDEILAMSQAIIGNEEKWDQVEEKAITPEFKPNEDIASYFWRFYDDFVSICSDFYMKMQNSKYSKHEKDTFFHEVFMQIAEIIDNHYTLENKELTKITGEIIVCFMTAVKEAEKEAK